MPARKYAKIIEEPYRKAGPTERTRVPDRSDQFAGCQKKAERRRHHAGDSFPRSGVGGQKPLVAEEAAMPVGHQKPQVARTPAIATAALP